VKGTINLLPQSSALIAIQFDGGASQPLIGSAGDCHYHLQIAR
jgi:hypothetical protein